MRPRKKQASPMETVVFFRRPQRGQIEKPFSCCQCGARFSKTYYLRLHQMHHTGERPHACDICGKAFRMRWRVALHRRIHTGEKPFACIACGFRANRKDNIRGHMKRRHGGVIYVGEVTAVKKEPAAKLKVKKKPSKFRVKKEEEEEEKEEKFDRELHRKAFKQELGAVVKQEEDASCLQGALPPMIGPLTRARARRTNAQLWIPVSGKLQVPLPSPVKEEPEDEKGEEIVGSEEPTASRGRPKRAAANLCGLRLLSWVLDEEDVKKEMKQTEKPSRGRRRRHLPETRPRDKGEASKEAEVVALDLNKIWITDDDLIFTDDGVLKLEEDIEILDE